MSTATELLRRSLDCMDWHCPQYAGLREEIRAFLAAEPEAEPDTWQSLTDDEVWEISKLNADDYEYFRAIQAKLKEKNHPPRPEPVIRKPMTEEEIDEELETNEYYCAKSFADGVRWAEKHHGIGGDDE